MIDVDSYLGRTFDLKRYNCWHMLRDAWLDLTGEDLGGRTPEDMLGAALAGAFEGDIPRFQRLDAPSDPCIVLLTRQGVIPHVGLYFRRRVLQMAVGGPSYVPLEMARLGFEEARYYR